MADSQKKKIIIDPDAGFCGGVKRAIMMVERSLESKTDVFVRGELIHNQREMRRLELIGLKLSPEVDKTSADAMFIRTHGESPEIYRRAKQLGLKIIDATCKNVRRSQKVIEKAAKEGRKIYIFGKRRHPEVIGLFGYCQGKGMIIHSIDDVNDNIEDKPSLLIPQTTAHPDRFEAVRQRLSQRIGDLQVYYAICPFVSHREEELRRFAAAMDAIVFVGGKHSSNTAVLFAVCQQVNENSFFIDNPEELRLEELSRFDVIGISGSASTPMWQLKEIARIIEEKIN